MATAVVVGVISAVVAVGTSVYSGISSHQTEVKSRKEAREARAGSAAAALQAGKIEAAADTAAMAEAKRIRAMRAVASTIKTSPEGILEAPTVMKQTLG